jgi:hypothetical protein
VDVLHCCGTPYTLNPSAGENKRGGGREREREKEREAPALYVMHVLVAWV